MNSPALYSRLKGVSEVGQTGSSQAAQGVRLRKNVESEKEGSDAILRNPKCHQLTDFLGSSVVVCVVTASSDVRVLREGFVSFPPWFRN